MVKVLGMLLLVLALVVPVLGAVVLRLLQHRLSERQVVVSASLLFTVAIVSVLVLARLPISDLQIGSFTLLLPISSGAMGYQAQPMQSEFVVTQRAMTETAQRAMTETVQRTITETSHRLEFHHGVRDMPQRPGTLVLTPTVTLVVALNTTLSTTPTITVVTTPTATVTFTPTDTPPPFPSPTDTPLPEPTRPRIHVVQEGEVLGSIAEKYGVSMRDLMRANGMSEEDAHRIQIGQELIIP